MSGKILRRGTICKKFHAMYLVGAPEFGKCYLCYRCWQARQSKAPTHPQDDGEKSAKKPKTEIPPI